MNCLILEDEPLAAQDLILTLRKLMPDVNILDTIESVEDAVDWFKTNRAPDLIFMDIHLADTLCFEIFNQVNITSPIIFTTAYDQYAIRAFQTNSIGYLLKPINEDDLNAALKKYISLTTTQITSLQNLLSTQQPTAPANQYRTRILVKLGDNYTHIPISEVAYFYSEDHYTFIATTADQRYIVNQTLDALDKQLDPTQFFRISRNCTVAINAIGNVSRHINGRLKINLNPPSQTDAIVSRNRVSSFLSWLDDQNKE